MIPPNMPMGGMSNMDTAAAAPPSAPKANPETPRESSLVPVSMLPPGAKVGDKVTVEIVSIQDQEAEISAVSSPAEEGAPENAMEGAYSKLEGMAES